MNTGTAIKRATAWLRSGQMPNSDCWVDGCDVKPTILVAGGQSRAVHMCAYHAIAWSESSLCRDVAQHNSGASLSALSAWMGGGADETA